MLEVRLDSVCPRCKENNLTLRCFLSENDFKFTKNPVFGAPPKISFCKFKRMLHCSVCGEFSEILLSQSERACIDYVNVDFSILENILRGTTQRSIGTGDFIPASHFFVFQEKAVIPWVSQSTDAASVDIHEVTPHRDIHRKEYLPDYSSRIASWYWNSETGELFKWQPTFKEEKYDVEALVDEKLAEVKASILVGGMDSKLSNSLTTLQLKIRMEKGSKTILTNPLPGACSSLVPVFSNVNNYQDVLYIPHTFIVR